jgi:hypothetical protein
MQTTCDNCFTVYDAPEQKRGPASCPYCEYINEPKPSNLSARSEEGLGIDPSKTMLTFTEGEQKSEGSTVQRIIKGKLPALPASRTWILTVLEGDEKGKRFLLNKPVIRIGRKEVDLALRDPEVSRQHCVIQIYDDTVILRDLKSANGTLVNGFMVKEELLKSQDRIRIGNSILQLTVQSKS